VSKEFKVHINYTTFKLISLRIFNYKFRTLDTSQQITFDFNAAEAVTTSTDLPAAAPKKRGRKPKDLSTVFQKLPAKRGRKSLKDIELEADIIEIPTDDILFVKQYYSMHEVAAMFRINHSQIRLWENEFDILQPKKNKKGDRFFRPVDVKNLHLIYHLLRHRKYTMEGAKEYLKNNSTSANRKFEMVQALQKIRNFLLEIKSNL